MTQVTQVKNRAIFVGLTERLRSMGKAKFTLWAAYAIVID
jgi:hypothetical protein